MRDHGNATHTHRAIRVDMDGKPPSRRTPNPNGTTGWVVVKRSTNAIYGQGESLRVHICAHDPCQVRHKPDKYVVIYIYIYIYIPPVHMQRITCMGPAAAPVLVWTAAPIADPSAIKTAVAASTQPTSAAHPATVANNCNTRHSRPDSGAGTREPQPQSLDWLHRINLVWFAQTMQTTSLGGRSLILFTEATCTLGTRDVHQAMCICSNPMRPQTKPRPQLRRRKSRAV